MPTDETDVPNAITADNLIASILTYPAHSTPTIDSGNGQQLIRDVRGYERTIETAMMSPPVSNNTAMGMSMMQEDSMYIPLEAPAVMLEVGRETDATVEDNAEDGMSTKSSSQMDGHLVQSPISGSVMPLTPISASSTPIVQHAEQIPGLIICSASQHPTTNSQLRTPSPDVPNMACSVKSNSRRIMEDPLRASGTPNVDKDLEHDPDTKVWDFSRRALPALYPSALFQPNSKYKGTQQSDKHIYNVEVTILTVDVEQATMSGYLQICELTPDHPTLTTFFTGEIIGGPEQKHSFRTSDPAWGASDKTDVTHWARFPAWRSLSSHAKKNINFVYPLDQTPWWQEENIFMRWKEHFLVPDYKLKSIQGASFEGFYYICLNQIEGKISGIYFHSKSEKYQQLELKHIGKQGVWGKGVCPSVEFR